MINSFADKDTQKLFELRSSKRYSAIQRVALRKLLMLHSAAHIKDLRAPPGNQLEALVGDRKGQHSIRVNRQWRICFNWNEGEIENVEICDYH